MPTTPAPIDPLGTPPSTSDTVNFDARADSFLGQFPTLAEQINAVTMATYLNASHAEDYANLAQNAAAAAVGSANAQIWVSDSIYAVGDVRYSPVNSRIYRRLVAGAGAIDPSLDATNWQLVTVSLADMPVEVVTATAVSAVRGVRYLLTNVATSTVALPITPGVGDSVGVVCANALATNVIARSGQTIMGLAEDLTINQANVSITLQFLSGTWRIV